MNQDRLQQLASLLTNLNSPDNAARAGAENELNSLWLNGTVLNQAELFVGLAHLATAGDASYRSFAAILLRRYGIKFTKDPNGVGLARVFDIIPPEAKQQIRDTLVQGFMAQQTRDTRHKLADTISELARDEQWDGLLVLLVEGAKNPEADMREATFRILASCPELFGVEQVNDAAQLLLAGFNDPSPLVQVAATEAFSAFFDKLPKNVWSTFKPLLPSLLNVMEPLRQNYQTLQLTAVLESLIDLAGIAPKMFSPVFLQVVEFALAVAGDPDMDETARMSALEFCVTFSQQAPQMCKSEPHYVERMLNVTLQMLVEIDPSDEETDEWNNEDECQANEEHEQVHNAAKDALDRMALRLDSSAMIGPLFQYIPKMLASTDWRQRHGALMALSSVAEGCRDIMINELGQILDMVLPHFADPHSRVQWAACNALGQMSTDFADLLQRRYGSRVLPALIAKLSNDSTYRVQVHAAAAIFNFSENATKDVLQPYLDDLLTGLLTLLQGPKRYVQEQALATISIVADAAQTKFAKYYDVLMPQLMNVLRADTGNEYQLLKAKSIECSTLIALAVGKEKFMPQFHELVGIFAKIQETTDEENPCQAYLVQAWARICKVIGPEFLPYLSRVIPPVLKVAKSSADCQLLDDEEAQLLTQKEGWEVQKFKGQYIGLHISGFEDKANCIERLGGYASELGADFYPYVPEIVKDIAIPSLSFFYFEEAQINACQLIPHLITSAQLAAGRETGDKQAAKSDKAVLQIWLAVYSEMKTLIDKGEIIYIMAEMLTTVFQCISLIGPASVPPEIVQPLMNTLVHITQQLNYRVTQRQEGDENDEFIEEEEEEEAEESDEALMDAVNKLMHVLFKVLKTDFLPYFDQFVPVLTELLNSPVTDSLELGLGIVDDLIEFTGPASAKYIGVFGDVMLQSVTHENPRVRQAAIYGLGVAAQHGGEQYQQAVLKLTETLFSVANAPDARDESNLMATENACSSIAKILRVHGAAFGDQLDMAIEAWIKTLPIIEDIEVAPYAYLFLSDLMDQKHPAVTSQINHVFACVSPALVYGSLQGKPARRVLDATKTLISTLPQDQAMSLFHGLPANEQPVIQHLFST